MTEMKVLLGRKEQKWNETETETETETDRNEHSRIGQKTNGDMAGRG
jgi:hypothetical protein